MRFTLSYDGPLVSRGNASDKQRIREALDPHRGLSPLASWPDGRNPLSPFHWEAFVFGLGAPQPGPDGVRTLAMPLGEARLPGITAEDIGRCAYPIFKDPARFVGETVGIAGEHTTGNQLAAGLSEVFGEPVRYQHVPAEVFRGLPFPGADLAANMFQFVTEDNGYGTRREVAVARSLNPSLVGFTEWVAATRGRVPVQV